MPPLPGESAFLTIPMVERDGVFVADETPMRREPHFAHTKDADTGTRATVNLMDFETVQRRLVGHKIIVFYAP